MTNAVVDELLSVPWFKDSQVIRHIVTLCCTAADFDDNALNKGSDWGYPACSFTGANVPQDNRLLVFLPRAKFPHTYVVHKDVVLLLRAIRAASCINTTPDDRAQAEQFVRKTTRYIQQLDHQ